MPMTAMPSTSTRTKPTLEVIPHTRYVLFDGDEHTAQPFKLRGIVRLTLPDSTNIKAVSVKLICKRSISVKTDKHGPEIFKRWPFQQSKDIGGTTTSHKTGKGVIDWPFDFTIAADCHETIEGLPDETWVRWQLSATVQRAGWSTRDLAATCDIRVVRTMSQDQLETTRSRINQDIWNNKVSYNVSIPTDAVVFGTSIPAHLEISPLKKGLSFGDIETMLYETVTKRITRVPDQRNDDVDIVNKEERILTKREHSFPHDSAITFDHEDAENPTMEDERYVFDVKLPLPKSLRDCRQDVDLVALQISHKIKILVNIHNPEGHVSQLVCRLPVKLFISPFLPINDNHVVQPTDATPSETELNNIAESIAAPPVYGSHLLDELYSDLRPHIISQVPSSAATPYAGLSRTGSSDNLVHTMQSLNGAADVSNEQLNSALLESRLANLQSSPHRRVTNQSPRNRTPSGPPTPFRGAFDHAEISNRPPLQGHHESSSSLSGRESSSPYRSRRSSRDAAVSSPAQESQDVLYDMGTLSRVPSYDAAVRTVAAIPPVADTPPTYLEATSRPPSPGLQQRALSNLSITPAANGTASPAQSSASTINPLSGLPEMQLVAATPIPETSSEQRSMLEDGPARLHNGGMVPNG